MTAPHGRSITIELADPLEALRKKRDNSENKRTVQTTPGQLVKEAPKDAFLGQQNQQVDRQTVNKEQLITMGAQPKAQTQGREAERSTPEVKSPTKYQSVPITGPLSGLAVPVLPSREATRVKQEDRNWVDPGSLPQDYVKGLKESERTALNTKEYVFYGYFQRIRERLDRAWVPILREKLIKLWRTGRQLASDMDHTTQVMVILNSAGEIVRVRVLSESGNRELDDAAIRAFNQAGPFPNPPHGIVNTAGEIEIPWQFILKT